jgi:Tol biopolymer transport system component
MRKLIITALAVTMLLSALMASAAVARPPGINGQIVFGRDDPLLEHVLYTINPDGSHEHQLLPFGLGSPVGRWSSDGSSIVTGGTATGDAALIVDPDTRTYRALANPDPAAFAIFDCVAPSPDFERLACGGFGKDSSLNGIYTVRTSDGGGLRRLTSDTIEDQIGDYSTDGKRLVYFHIPTEVFPPAPSDPPNFDLAGLFVSKVNGTASRKIAPCCSSGGSWSAQGNQIVFSWSPPALSFETSFHSTIWIVHSDGSGLHEIHVPGCDGGPRTDPEARGCADAGWSPDGRKIVFRRTTPGFGEGGDVYTVNADGSGLFQVTHDGDVDSPDWGTHPLARG